MSGNETEVVGLGIVFVVWLIAMVIMIAMIVAQWKIFTKAGESGWASIIPVYSSYVLAKIVYGKDLGYVGIVGLFLNAIPVIGSIVSTVFWFYTFYLLFKSYECGTGKAIAFVIFTAIGYLCVGLGSATYMGVQDNVITQKLAKK